MRRISLLSLAAFALQSAIAQTTPAPGYYEFPVRNVAGTYSANFGEMRPNHFHSGVDIKTDGVTGKPVVAAADGYIARIAIAPGGYGRALYIAHPNGTTTVYAHLDRFREDIETYVREQRYARRRNAIDLWCTAGQFPVGRGERIALSGNSGQSFGPHLHFEVRRSSDQKTLNSLANKWLPVRDTIPPLIARLHYIEIDSLDGVAVRAPRRTYEIACSGGGNFRLRRETPLEVGRRGYFLLEVSDRKNEVSNTFGVYRIAEEIDGEIRFEYRMDGFRFGDTRYCNAVSCYPLQLRSRNEAIRLAQTAGSPSKFYTVVRNRGILNAAAGQRRSLRIVAEDDCGNRSTLAFETVGKPDERCFRATRSDSVRIIRHDRDFRASRDGVTLFIPRGTLYESRFHIQGPYSGKRPDRAKLLFLSEGYTVLDVETPLHGYATVSIPADVPAALRGKVALASLSPKGALRFEGGKYHDGELTLRTRSLGTFFVVADTLPPVIRPRFEGSDWSKRRSVSFSLGDDFAGIASFEGSIDGKWIIFEQNSVQGTITHYFDDRIAPRGQRHTMVVTATDRCGNRTEQRLEFSR